MSDPSDVVPKSEVLNLAARIRELEAQVIRTPVVVRPRDEGAMPEPPPTNCNTNTCTCCSDDGFGGILLPGEIERLSGAELVSRLQAEGELRLVRRASGPPTRHEQLAAGITTDEKGTRHE